VAEAKRHHPKAYTNIRQNLGDLFTYALVKEFALQLFFQGTNFANTTVENRTALLGYGMSDKGVPQPTDISPP
jgi:uncharacterized protein with PIN domain